MLCKAPSQLSQTEGTYILCVGTADRLKPSTDPCCDNHKDRNGQWSFLHEHSASPCPSLTATFSLTLFLTFISVPTPVTSCHSSTMFWSDQLANYSSSLVKGLKKDKNIDFLPWSVPWTWGLLLSWDRSWCAPRSPLRKKGRLREIHLKCAQLKLQPQLSTKGLVSWQHGSSS